ncbi:hypothetical protein MYAM1_003029 [Malassezia yamatoensis]|uniref:Uncharacterized protein n=1 Tax=Malassezia yamatoensis TaxID=253288 RepID=A0AAJ5YVM8_9BASI|nr:hypothetical protein MYAM1_003029 [Malassezia yamatoensis]
MDMRQQAYGPHTRPDEHGSRTLTIQNTEADGAATSSRDVGVLHLRAPQRSDLENSSADRSGSARRVMWTDDTVDNEGLGRKKSKTASLATIRMCQNRPKKKIAQDRREGNSPVPVRINHVPLSMHHIAALASVTMPTNVVS